MQPHSGIVLDIGFCDGEFGAFAGVEDRGHGSDELGCNLAEMLRNISAFIVGEHAVFLRIEDGGIADEMELHFFAVDFHLRLWKGSFEAIGRAFIEGAEGNGVFAVHFEVQFIVVLANLGKFLAHRRLDGLVVCAFLGRKDFGASAKGLVIDIERESGILKQGAAL